MLIIDLLKNRKRPYVVALAISMFGLPVSAHAVAINYFSVTGSPDWSAPSSRAEIGFSDLFSAGSLTLGATSNPGYVALSSLGASAGSELSGSVSFNYQEIDPSGGPGAARSLETSFHFIALDQVFGFNGPAGEWRSYDPQFYYLGGEKIFSDVLHPAALPYLDFFYDRVNDRGSVVWSAVSVPASGCVPDEGETILLLFASLAGASVLARFWSAAPIARSALPAAGHSGTNRWA